MVCELSIRRVFLINENTVISFTLQVLLQTKFCWDNQTEYDGKDGDCSTYKREDKYTQVFGRKIYGKEVVRKTDESGRIIL
jgi:hypothetical protein